MEKQPIIKFGTKFDKLNGIIKKDTGQKAKLLQIFKVNITQLTKDFIEYDTQYGKDFYPIDKKYYILLIFQEKKTQKIFTTLRKATDGNWLFFSNHLGVDFDVVIENNL